MEPKSKPEQEPPRPKMPEPGDDPFQRPNMPPPATPDANPIDPRVGPLLK
jgi:hypothetical protein